MWRHLACWAGPMLAFGRSQTAKRLKKDLSEKIQYFLYFICATTVSAVAIN